MKRHRLSTYILLGLVLGVIVGYFVNVNVPSGPQNKEIAEGFNIVADAFLRLIKMVIAPLVFSGIVTGMANSDGPKELGRIGGKAMAWFFIASVMSLGLGMALSNLYGLGVGVHMPQSSAGAVEFNNAAFSLKTMVAKIVPQSVVLAMAQNEIMAILLFAVFFGFGLSAVCKQNQSNALTQALDDVFHVMLKIARYVMYAAPVGVFAAVAAAISQHGIGVLLVYGRFVGGVYSGFFLLCCTVVLAGYVFLGKRVFQLIASLREPLLVGFSTASSEAALPKMLERLTNFGVPRKVSTFVLPLAYSFNLDGAMMYQAFATIFLVQAYHLDVSLGQQLGMLMVMLIASKGSAGVPRGSLVILTAMLPTFGIPVEGVVLLLAVDVFVDMGRTVTNLIGNGVATAALAHWEGKRSQAGMTEGLAAPAGVDIAQPALEHGTPNGAVINEGSVG
ncbi:dicarboxylate/amino acid:cation symporter [Paraburkholderia xenovorans]|uniref:dicarboxylate/amino acid:cation symporter n=1 Tax=Paraburkholderia xenovorans TaxID=36873 RepID=UPI0038BBEC09